MSAAAWIRAARLPAQSNIALPLFVGEALACPGGVGLSWATALLVGAFGLFDQLYIVFANDVADVVHATVGFWGLLGMVLAVFCFLKEKFWIGVAGFFIWPIAVIGAIRLGRPGSPWARRFYGEEKMAKATERFGERDHRAHPAAPRREGEDGQRL